MSGPSVAAGRRLDRRLLVALALAVLLHGGLLLSGSYRGTYDGYIHLFFADHYARGWFETWEPRWYTGFSVVSYPPAVHQLVAVWSFLVGLELGLVVVFAGAVVLLVLGVYRFALLWVSREAAGWAALLAVLSSSLAETVHVYGQVPTTLSLGFLLNALPSLRSWIVSGQRRALLVALACVAATTGAHHVTTLFGAVFFAGPVVVAALLHEFRSPLPDETPGRPSYVTRTNLPALLATRLRRVQPAVLRCGVFGFSHVTILLVVVLPYWLYSRRDPITQTPIPHGSRANFLADHAAGLMFWLVPWGVVLLLLPFALARAWHAARWPLGASTVLATLLGTGGTTPVPRMLLGGAFDVLTLDRFTFWATILVLPLAGEVIVGLRRGAGARWLRHWFGRWTWAAVQASLVVAVVAVALVVATLTGVKTFQPAPVDPEPIAQFLAKDQHHRWRYLTLGLGDQMAWVSAHTTATTVDGNYHSARRLPELTSFSVERLEGAKFRGVAGIGSLQQFLGMPERYHLKFVFSNDEFYDPLLSASGWLRVGRLENGVVVWERADIAPLPATLPTMELPGWQRVLWGTLPLTAVALATLALVWLLGFRAPPVPRRQVESSPVGAAARPGRTGTARVVRWRRRRTTEPLPRWRRRLHVALLVSAVGALGLAPVARSTEPPGPRQVVRDYYQALDVRDFEKAWELLDPSSRPPYELFLLQQSVGGGLVASYAKLQAVDTRLKARTARTATVDARLRMVTSLLEHRTAVTRSLVRHHGEWFLRPLPVDLSSPPDELVRRPGVSYRDQGRRTVTAGTTPYADILDRPVVRVVSARLVNAQDRLQVVGSVVNTDVVPADVTVTADLVDPQGRSVASYNAQTSVAHLLLPGQSTPFRVDFEGIATAADLAEGPVFTPQSRTALTLPSGTRVSDARVYVKAVVASRETDLRSAVGLQGLRVRGSRVVGFLRNDGLVDATVPRILVSLLDRNGEVGWTQEVVLDSAVRAQRTLPFSFTVTPRHEVSLVARATTFDNGLPGSPAPFQAAAQLPAAAGSGWSSLRLDVLTFSRDVS